MKKIALLLAVSVLFSCNKKTENKVPVVQNLDTAEILEGKKLMETHCYLCHSPNAAEKDGRIAPPMIAIKAHYIDNQTTKDEFVAAIQSFIDNPTEDKVHLKGAFKRFGLMPKQVFPAGSVQKIANFMYDYQIEEPSWFAAHWQSKGNENWTQTGKKFVDESKPKTNEEIGLEYALSTKKILGKNLMGAIQKNGTLAALSFCNIKAMPLTDSMATKYNAVIKRVSDKNRNPNNKANQEELKYINQFKNDMFAKKEIKPVMIEKGNEIHFYYPIQTNTMCLQCHGEQIKPEVSKQILKLYPNDLAVGYSENQIRGIWSIKFNKK
jgi:cytochrome c553